MAGMPDIQVSRTHLDKTDAAMRALDAWRAWAMKLVGRNMTDSELQQVIERLLVTARKEQGKWI